MRKPRPLSSLALSLFLLAGVPLAGCTQEVSRMDPELAAQAFPGNAGMAELAAAVRSGNVDEVKRLAPAVDLDAKGDRDVTLLQWAILNRQQETFAALLDAGANPSIAGLGQHSAWHTAARADSPVFLEALLQRDKRIDLPHAATAETPLASAVTAGYRDNVDLLLTAGADIDAVDRMGNTALHAAGKTGDASLALLLLEAGARSDLRNDQDRTFDHYLFLMDTEFLTTHARSEMEKVRALLPAHGDTDSDI